jgi:DNA helicase-4
MKDLEQLSILFLFVITGIWYYAKRKKKRKKLLTLYKSKLDFIKIATGEFANFLDFKTGYFTNYQLSTWKNQQTNLYNELKGKPFEYINLSSDDVKMIKEFNNYFEHSWNLITDYNRTFLIEELEKYNSFFNDIEGRKLDKQQRTAIVTDEDNNIVIAGAGSGKTTTIIGKINYIIERYKINPHEILLISFTNKSALTLSQRIDIEGIDAKTFHKFGKDIIAKSEGRQPSIFDDSQFKPLLTKIFYSLIENENYLKNVTDYFTDFLKPIKSQFEFDNQGDYIQYIKDHNFKPYKLKEVLFKGKTTFKMEVVKSIEECKIANFFLFNGIDYEYEEHYEYCTANETYRQYKPDFTVKQNGKKVYIEHFGVSREGNVPKFFAKNGETLEEAKNRYWEKINWARELHRTNETILYLTE